LKAFLLAAGFGTRLYPLTREIPKCMMLIENKPMLYHWFKLFATCGITEVLINLHYLHEQVIAGIEEYKLASFGMNIVLSYETELLGTAGTIRENASWLKDEKDFIIAYADNLTKVNIEELISYHQEKEAVVTLWLYHTDVPKEHGIATLDDVGHITEFIEKPEKPKSEYASAALYVATPELITYIPKGFADLGIDVLPKLSAVGKLYGCTISGYNRGMGDPIGYEKAQKEWKELQ